MDTRQPSASVALARRRWLASAVSAVGVRGVWGLSPRMGVGRGSGALLGMAAAAWSAPAHAGQAEEPLADSVRTAMARAVHDSGPPDLEFAHIDERLAYLRWLGAMSPKLATRMPEFETRRVFLETVWYESRRAGLEPALVLGLIQVESAFRKYAVSWVGARGYMQIMPFWMRLIGDGEVSGLFHMQTNLRFGCVILRHYLDREKGDLYMALGRYNGSRGQPQYPNLVMGARKNWLYTDVQASTRSADAGGTPPVAQR